MRPASDDRRAVLFDMDGVLVDSTSAHVRAWRRWLDDQGLEPPAEGIASLFGRRAAEAVAGLLGLPEGSDASLAALRELESHADRELGASSAGGRVVPGAEAVVTGLVDAGWRVAVVTSAVSSTAVRSLGPLRASFGAVVTADDVRRGKPDPEPYLTAARLLDVPASRCIVVEDAVAGVMAGRAAGMRVVGVTSTAAEEQLRAAGAHEIVAHVTELPDALAALA